MAAEIPEERPEQMVLVDNLTEDHIAKWDRFCGLINEAIAEVFGGDANVILGLQFGGMGSDADLPLCVGTSTMPVCETRAAVEDLVKFFDAQHTEAHQNHANHGVGNFLTAPMALENVPDEVRERIEALIAEMGGTMDNVQFIEVVDTHDLADLPETEEQS